MADQINLPAERRESTGSSSVGRLRRDGKIPGVVYGASQDNYAIQLSDKAFRDILRHSASEQILVNLQIEGAKEANKLALIQDVQHHPLNGQILHIDFNAVNEDQEITARVPVELTGEVAGVKHGGILDTLQHEIEVQCLPKNLPSIIPIDASELEIGDSLSIADVTFPDGVTPVLDSSTLVAIVNESRAAASEGLEDEELEGVEGEEGEGEGEDEETSEE